MRKSAPVLLSILCIIIFSFSSSAEQHNGLLGIWEYADCRIKNTSVRGTIQFKKNNTFVLNAIARDDYPVEPIKGKYHYSLKGNEITTDYKNEYGIGKYYYIRGNVLYFSDVPPNAFPEGEPDCCWKYKLYRVKDGEEAAPGFISIQ